MRKVLRLILLAVLFCTAAGPLPSAAAKTKNPDVDRAKVRVLLVLGEQSALVASALEQPQQPQLPLELQTWLDRMERPQRLRTVVESLRGAAGQNQRPALDRLNVLQRQGKVEHVRPLWIVNAIAVTAPGAMLPELASLPGVARVTPDVSLHLTPLAPSPESAAQNDRPASLAANLAQVNVSALWNKGYKGKGIVVANLDTGVSLNNPDLKARWRGGNNSWFDPHQQFQTPTDTNGHGSATMGIMVSEQYGMAPEARWIAVKMFDENLNAQLSDALQGYQWLLDPDGNPNTDDAPQVVNNSWSEGTPGCTDEPALRAALRALSAAGILPVFAAGNLGSLLENGSPMPSTGPIPSVYPEVLAVGAVDPTSQIAPFSSTGPTDCRPKGMSFPDLVAPGVGITSTNPDGGGFPAFGLSGTSFSAPHAAGALALVLDAFPNLTAKQQRAVLQQSTLDLGNTGSDSIYGSGDLDLTHTYEIASKITGEINLPFSIYLPLTKK